MEDIPNSLLQHLIANIIYSQACSLEAIGGFKHNNYEQIVFKFNWALN